MESTDVNDKLSSIIGDNYDSTDWWLHVEDELMQLYNEYILSSCKSEPTTEHRAHKSLPIQTPISELTKLSCQTDISY